MSSTRRSSRCTSAGRVTASVLLSFLACSPALAASAEYYQSPLDYPILPVLPPLPKTDVSNPISGSHRFSLRHVYHHGTAKYPTLFIRKDHEDLEAPLWTTNEKGHMEPMEPLVASSQGMFIHRLKDRRPSVVDPMVASVRQYGAEWDLPVSAWSVDEIAGPNITDKATVLTLAQMAQDAYVRVPNTEDWEDISNSPYNETLPFGWETDSIQGHVFADETNSTVIIAIKGTTLAVWDGPGTTTNDKVNDNLFGSCCCAQQGQWTWKQVCDCATDTYACNNTCVIKELRSENRYYSAARNLYSNVTEVYPDANIWLVGHSLGGAVSSLIGLTYGIPAVTFQAVPDALAAGRLGLPNPPGFNPATPQARPMTGAFHFGHTADPVYMGTCTGPTASCSFAGYAFESTCHSGLECIYDVVGDKGWRVSITTHTIKSVIANVIKPYDTVPVCESTPECVDCALWKFYESNSSEPITSTSSIPSKTRTRTETCKTPGWWGCLDDSTTTSATSTSTSTTTTTTSTCKTPGWFGCKDETTTRTTSTSSTTTSTCKTPGWFGCKDPTSTGTITSPTAHPITSAPARPAPVTSTRPIATMTSATSTSAAPHETCARRSWLGRCLEWDAVEEI